MRISGARGVNASSINGTYDPEEGLTEGMPVYRKRGDGDKWLEYWCPIKKWMVRPSNSRGTARGWATLLSDPPRLPEDTHGAVWEVHDGSRWGDQYDVSVTLVSLSYQRLFLLFPLFWGWLCWWWWWWWWWWC